MPHSPPSRWAIVTGTSAGIGRAVARELLGRGWSVLGIARRPAPFDQATYHHVAYDLADVAGDSRGVRAQLNEWIGPAQPARLGLVNNAAVAEG